MSQRREQLAAVKSKRPFADGTQAGRGLGVSTRVKGYLMSQLYELLRNIRNHTFCPAVEFGGHTFV